VTSVRFSPGRVARAPRVPQIRGPQTGGRRRRTGQYVEVAGGRRSRILSDLRSPVARCAPGFAGLAAVLSAAAVASW
jgi:hypothetical protein